MIVVAAIAVILLTLPAAVQARSCHHDHGHTICLDQVQRSAKYHWRYRVQATVDGAAMPLTRYNCRDRTQTRLNGAPHPRPEPFASDGVGTLVCRLVHR